MAKVDRNRLDADNLYKGSNWFSITESMAKYVLFHKKYINNRFKYTQNADEMFIQTLAVNSAYRDRITNTHMRFIDWERGNGCSPYTFSLEDYDLLMKSGKLFARKFSDENIDLVKKIYGSIEPD